MDTIPDTTINHSIATRASNVQMRHQQNPLQPACDTTFKPAKFTIDPTKLRQDERPEATISRENGLTHNYICSM